MEPRNLPYVEVMKPTVGSQQDLNNPLFSLQRKYDGSRTLAFKRDNDVYLVGRSYKNLYNMQFPDIVREIQSLPIRLCVLDGELTFFDDKGRDVFLTVLALPETRGNLMATFIVFDVLSNGENLEAKPIEERLEILNDLIPYNLPHVKLIETFSNNREIYDKIIKEGGEGVVLKMNNSRYVRGRSSLWRKIKRNDTQDCIVIGCTEGKGERSDAFGSLILAQIDHNGNLQYVGKTSGFNQSQMRELLTLMNQYKASTPPPINLPSLNVKFWVKPKIVVEVRYGNITNGHLRFPVFERIRYDKQPCECIINEGEKQ